MSGPAWPTYNVDAESNTSSMGFLLTTTVSNSKQLRNSVTFSFVTLNANRVHFFAKEGTTKDAIVCDNAFQGVYDGKEEPAIFIRRTDGRSYSEFGVQFLGHKKAIGRFDIGSRFEPVSRETVEALVEVLGLRIAKWNPDSVQQVVFGDIWKMESVI
ncbi:unnamed protein product [Leptosia nina]|uniref:Uncharacterized protein n=1 Tax=Leptosia nina TaxID=320188 RepID=A0AAV1JPN0_9NEOP